MVSLSCEVVTQVFARACALLQDLHRACASRKARMEIAVTAEAWERARRVSQSEGGGPKVRERDEGERGKTSQVLHDFERRGGKVITTIELNWEVRSKMPQTST